MTTSHATQRIAVVGTGKLARALVLSLPDRVTDVAGRNAQRARDTALLGADTRAHSLSELHEVAFDVLWIATADAAIEGMAIELAAMPIDWNGKTIVHSSGAFGIALLDAVRMKGARVLALHPNASLRGNAAIPTGTVWGVAPTDDEALDYSLHLLAPLLPRLLPVQDTARPLYHAAASTASNFTVTLFALAELMYKRAGIDATSARELVGSFMLTSVERAYADGATASLTGPVSRGDGAVVAEQRVAVAAHAPEALDMFDAMVAATREVALSA